MQSPEQRRDDHGNCEHIWEGATVGAEQQNRTDAISLPYLLMRAAGIRALEVSYGLKILALLMY